MIYKSNNKNPIIGLAIAACLATATLPAGVAGQKSASEDEKMKSATRATSIEGMDLHAKNGKDLGSIDDIIFSSESGQIEALIIDTGFLGIGGPDRKVGIDQIQKPRLNPYDMKTSISESEFNETPIFDEVLLDKSTNPEGVATGQVMAFNAIGRDLQNESGGELGVIHDWIVDLKNGYIPYAIIIQEDPLATQSFNFYAIATNRIVGMENGDIVASISEADLDQAQDLTSETPLKVNQADSAVYQFRYDAKGMLSKN